MIDSLSLPSLSDRQPQCCDHLDRRLDFALKQICIAGLVGAPAVSKRSSDFSVVRPKPKIPLFLLVVVSLNPKGIKRAE